MTTLLNEITNFWNKRPCNIRHSKKKLGTLEYFEEVKNKRYFVEPHIPDFAQFKNWKDKTVLELGCGIGTDSIEFAKAGAKVTVIDISEESVKLTKQRFDVYGYDAEYYVGNLEELSNIIPHKKYDLIYSFGVIHHAEFPKKIISELKNYSHDSTIIKIMLYNKFSWKSFSFFVTDGWKFWFNFNKTIQYFAEAQLNCPRALTYSKGDLLKLFKEYKILKIKKDHIFVYSIPEYINGNYVKTTCFKCMPNFIFNWLKKNFGWHYLIDLKI